MTGRRATSEAEPASDRPREKSRAAGRSRRAGVAKRLLFATVPSLLVTLLLLEIVFRTAVPACSLPHAVFDRDERLVRYDATGPRDGLHTIGAFAEQRGRWHVNDAGWASPVEFVAKADRRAERPLVAVIGDSYVEAFQVDASASFVALLRASRGERIDVYGFGMSGAPLAQYRRLAEHARRRYSPDLIVVLLVHNDFEESLTRRRNRPFFWSVTEADASGAGSFRDVPPEPYVPSAWRRCLGRSALVRYLWLNLHVETAFDRAAEREPSSGGALPAPIVGAAEYLFARIAEERGATPIVFVMDAPRSDVYAGSAGRLESRNERLNALAKRLAERHGFPFLDLTDAFVDHHRRSGERLESPYDWHWNEVGHRVAARELERFLAEEGLLGAR